MTDLPGVQIDADYRPDEIPSDLTGPDQSTALLEWLGDVVPNGTGNLRNEDGSLVRDDSGGYVRGKSRVIIDRPLRIDLPWRPIGRTDIVLEFTDGGFFRQAPTGGPQICLTHSNFWEIVRPLVRGTKPSTAGYSAANENQAAILFESCVWSRVWWPNTDRIWGDHFTFGKHAGDPTRSRNCHVYGGVCGESGRDPMAFTACEDCTVEGTTFGEGRTCIDMEPNGTSGGVYRSGGIGCTFNGPYTGIFFAAQGKDNGVGVVESGKVTDNVVNNGNIQALIGGGERRTGFDVSRNRGDKAVGNGRQCLMQFKGVTGTIVVTDNHNPTQENRNMRVARFPESDTADITYERNWKDWV